MSITLQLSPEKQAALERLAAAASMDVSTYVLRVVQEEIDERDEPRKLSYEQWSKKFRAWQAKQTSHNPHFDDSRESIYD
ncbi:MAG: hypothetical protein IAG10_06620 [Planctomycetaceae bacterium]|nr:hypothetical protein [Planctomycetaceae bacterium]